MDLSRRNCFASLALDRAAERRSDPLWLDAAWPRARVIQVSFDGRARLAGVGADALDSRLGAELGSPRPATACWLGTTVDAEHWFALPAIAIDHTDEQWIGLREAALQLSHFESALFAYAKALLLWQTRARFCGVCAHPTILTQAGHCATCGNPDCKLEHYPRTDAAVIVLITHGVQCLLGRQPGWRPKGYSTLAGFVEPGESLEDAVRREMLEEAGVEVTHCRYHSSQPWPFPASLMLGFRAEAAALKLKLGAELEDARWFDAESLLAAVAAQEVLLSPPISLSFRLITDWLLEYADAERVRGLLPGA